jgi:hypothetical protein
MMLRLSNHALHLLVEAALGAAGVALLATGALAWRLHQGPIDITWIARRAEARLVIGRAKLSVGQAELTWEGFSAGDSPLDIRWHNLAIIAPDGVDIAGLPRGRVTLDLPSLLVGRVVPRLVEIDGATITLQRLEDGRTRMDLGDEGTSGGSGGGARLLAALARQSGPDDPLSVLNQLRHVGIKDATLVLKDAHLGVVWQAHAGNVSLTRGPDGGIQGHAELALRVGDVAVNMTAAANLDTGGTQLVVTTTQVVPYALALAAPLFAPLAAVDAPMSAALSANFAPDLSLREATLSLLVGQGQINTGRGQAPIESASLVVHTDGHDVDVPTLRLAFRRPKDGVAPAPVVTGHAHAVPKDGAMLADFALAIDSMAFADLPLYWPHGTGGGSRPWITENITGGTARDGHVAGQLSIDRGTGAVSLVSINGGLSATGLQLWWLRPVPPLENGVARLVLEGPDALRITVASATQGPLALRDGVVRITGLAAKDQFADIKLAMQGGLADTLALLANPRLNLLSRHPIQAVSPAGGVDASLHVVLPLATTMTMAEIGIDAKAALTDVHLGQVVVGRDLDHGQLSLAVTSNTLAIDGTGTLGGLPAKLGMTMDFRGGPPTEVLEHYTAAGSASPAVMQGLGLPAGIMTGGVANVAADYTLRRDGGGTIAVSADLGPAALTTPIGWHKAAGQKASAQARLLLRDGHLAGFDRITAQGPGLSIASHAELVGGVPSVLRLDQLRVDRTDAAGAVMLAAGGKPLHVSLHGSVLDLSAYLAQRDREQPASAVDDDTPGPPWSADLRFGQVVLARDETLQPAAATAVSDGVRLTHLDVSAGAKGEVRVTISPGQAGRKLTVDSADAGAVLLASGVANNIRGGKLRVDGTYADTQPHAPLSGTATLADFRVTNAPALAQLLNLMTLYGTVDVLQGPGLGFSKAIVPFRWRQRVLHVESARAFSVSLGLTVQGDVDLRHQTAALTGTIVPAYFFNQLLGNIPLLGLMFSPEKGGGVFAASYSVKGPLAHPQVGINPLSALTPGVLRNIFNLL